MMTLADLKKSILSDGKIDASEVAQIREVIYANGKIDTPEAEFLFDVNDGCPGTGNDAGWESLFTETICAYLLNNENSPGEIDPAAADWLLRKIQGNGKSGPAEKMLLVRLRSPAKKMPDQLLQWIQSTI